MMKKLVLLIIYSFVLSLSCFSQDDECKSLYNTAMEYYNKGDCNSAMVYFKRVREKCGEYIGVSSKIKECREKLTEKPPINKPKDPPSTGTLLDNNENTARKTAYMRIKHIDFYSVTKDGDILQQISSNTYASDVEFLQPVLHYTGLCNTERQVKVYYKIIYPDGRLITTDNSPDGYTNYVKFEVQPAPNSTYKFTRFNRFTYYGGTYMFELWYDNSVIYSTTFTLKEIENVLSQGKWKRFLEKSFKHPTQHFDGSTDKYKGQVTKDNKRDGLGFYAWINENKYYIGQWQLNKWTGKGIFMVLTQKKQIPNCPNCQYYIGEFYNKNKSGYGRCYDRLGNLLYNGRFVNDKPADSYPSTGSSTYKFECIEYNNGDCYVGETTNGQRSGLGFYMWDNGDLWYGSWSNDTRSNNGVFMYYDGRIATGKLGHVK